MKITLNKGQHRFLTSQSKIVCGLSGRAGGKTFAGALSCIYNMIRFPNSIGMVGAANPAMLSSVCTPAIINLLKEAEVPFTQGRRPDWDCPEQKSFTNTISIPNGSIILLRSFHEQGADRNIRGLNLDYFWL